MKPTSACYVTDRKEVMSYMGLNAFRCVPKHMWSLSHEAGSTFPLSCVPIHMIHTTQQHILSCTSSIGDRDMAVCLLVYTALTNLTITATGLYPQQGNELMIKVI